MSLLGSLLLLSACRAPVSQQLSLNDIARKYIVLAVGLGERDPDSLDYYFGPEKLVADIRRQPPTDASIAQQAGALLDALEQRQGLSATDRQRVAFLHLQLNAIKYRAGMLAATQPPNQEAPPPPFDEQSRNFFGITAGPDTEAAARAKTRAEVAILLGTRTNLAHAYSLFDSQFVVKPDRVPAVMNAALAACRTETLKHIELPAGEHVDVKYVYNKPWSAFSRYLGNAHSVIQVNMDFPLTVDRIFNLACHEGYPGHHVFNTIRDQTLVERDHQEEWQVQPTFSPQSLVSEAAASYAPEVAFPAEQRLRVERDVLFPVAGLDAAKAARYLQVERLVGSLDSADPAIARDYLDGRLEFVRAADALERETLMEHAETMLLYLNEYRTYMLTYTIGRSKVQQFVEKDSPSPQLRWARYSALMTKPVDSLDSF